MKLQISYDLPSLQQALEIAKITASYADILEIGTSLLFANGIESIKAFCNQFPDKPIMVDAKVIIHSHITIPLFISAGAQYISVLAGATNASIKHATTLAHASGAKIVLDLLDSVSPGQSAVDAKILEVDTILFHRNYEAKSKEDVSELWQEVRENTSLPIFIEGGIDRSNIDSVLNLKPQGVIIGYGIIKADNPVTEAAYFKELLNR